MGYLAFDRLFCRRDPPLVSLRPSAGRGDLHRHRRATAAEQQAEQTPEAPGLLEGERIDLNTATLSDLTRLPGIGEKKGQAILDKRTELGGFQSVDQLLEVRGIGEGILARISPYVTVTP